MDANKRSEVNNQTNNNANEKWQPGAKGNTTTGPMDHTYPQGASQQQNQQDAGQMGTQQSGMGPGARASGEGSGSGLAGGSMQSQQTGGTGATQGITDSHQRAMEQRSGAYGQLEQPVGGRPDDQGTDLRNQQRSTEPATERMNPQDPRQPELQGGSLGGHHGNQQSTQGGGQHGPQSDVRPVQQGSMNSQSAVPQGTQGGGTMGNHSGGSMQGGSQHSTDRQGSQTDARQYDAGGVHQSNDVAGGLPRSPGNSGPWPDRGNGNLTGAQNVADLNNPEGGVHESNNMMGGLPRSPGGANKLRADEAMDDDTGFSNKRR